MEVTEDRLKCPNCGSPVSFRITALLRSDDYDPRPRVQAECFCSSPRDSRCTFDVIYEEPLEVPNAVLDSHEPFLKAR